jgi:hypothetical protein
MPTAQPKSGVTEYTVTTDTGPVTLTGPATGYRGWVSADDGRVWHYAIRQAGTTFETGRGTYDHASRTLSRTTVLGNKNGTTSPLNLGGGTKEVSITLPGELVAMLDCVGEWEADQHFNGQRLYLDSAQTSWIDMASTGVFKLYIESILVSQTTGNLGNLTLFGTNDTATEGPELTLRRDSASPAGGDALGVIRVQGKDANGATQSVFKVRSNWISTSAGSHSSSADISIASSGALQSVMQMRPNTLVVPSGINLFSAGKTATSPTTIGAELFNDGSVAATTNNTTPFFAVRNGTDGALITFLKGAVTVNSIGIVNGDIQYNGFSASHWSDWAIGQGGPEFETPGTVVSTAEGTMPSPGTTPLIMVRPACGPDDSRVYGVVGSRQNATLGTEERSYLSIKAIGDAMIRVRGAVNGGNLLRASLTPGVAEAIPDDTPITVRVLSCIVGRATQDSPDDGGERLIPCVLSAG